MTASRPVGLRRLRPLFETSAEYTKPAITTVRRYCTKKRAVGMTDATRVLPSKKRTAHTLPRACKAEELLAIGQYAATCHWSKVFSFSFSTACGTIVRLCV